MSWEYQVSGVPLLTWLALSRHRMKTVRLGVTLYTTPGQLNGYRPSTGALRLTLSACAQGAGSGAAAGPTKTGTNAGCSSQCRHATQQGRQQGQQPPATPIPGHSAPATSRYNSGSASGLCQPAASGMKSSTNVAPHAFRACWHQRPCRAAGGGSFLLCISASTAATGLP